MSQPGGSPEPALTADVSPRVRRRSLPVPPAASRSFSSRQLWPTAAIVGLLFLFATLSYTAVLGKSATFDEPLHVIGGAAHRYLHDFRINPEDPALFGWWSSLPHSVDAMPLNSSDAFYEGATLDMNQQWFFVNSTLYGRGAAAADAYLNTSRMMFTVLGVALGIVIAIWGYNIGGFSAAVASTVLFCLDPNFLAHTSLVKNDVPLSLLILLLAYGVWRFGRQQGGSILFFLLAAVACGFGLNVKFSAVLFAPMVVVLILIRALMPMPWRLGPLVLKQRWKRMILCIVTGAFTVVLGWLITWGVYGFRYSATTTGDPMNSAAIVQRSAINKLRVDIERKRTAPMNADELAKAASEDVKFNRLALPVRINLWMQNHHVLPEGWLFGFLYTYTTTLIRSAYLLGNIRVTGWWYYFPMAMLFKTPTATLLAIALAPLVFVSGKWSKSSRPSEEIDSNDRWQKRWTAAALLVPPCIYLAAAMMTNLNLGLRHMLPVYPFIFVVLGVIFSKLMRIYRLLAQITGAVLLIGLLTSTLTAYPDYLAFFNLPSGGSRGGLRLLGDSNLDWGQDLPALVQWQHGHPNDRLYLCYFGMANPSSYGLDFVNLPGGYPLAPTGDLSGAPGVVAISATNVQGIYMTQELLDAYHRLLRNEPPMEVLNGTIYLYEWPPR